MKIATKLTHFLLRGPEDMQKTLDLQLKKLQTDHIDYYFLHSLNAAAGGRLKYLMPLVFWTMLKQREKY